MKLTLKIKLLPTDNQANDLYLTIIAANAACNIISTTAWDTKTFNQFKLHRACYCEIKASHNLASQLVIRCLSKVADAYKADKKTKREFKPTGSITYDSRILAYKQDKSVSIWSINGRLKIPFICHNEKYLPFVKGEADLVYKNKKFYLFQVVDIPDESVNNVEDFIGVDFGLIAIATLSNGKQFCSQKLNNYREKRQKVRSSIQRKGTRGSRRLLKRLSGKERVTATIINHTISKTIISIAKSENRGISIENLTGIRFSAHNKGKAFRSRVGKWSFNQLRQFIKYKAAIAMIPFVIVNPAYTSKTCNKCKHIGDRKGRVFNCKNCGNNMDSDINAAINIATLGAVINQPERCDMYSCAVHF